MMNGNGFLLRPSIMLWQPHVKVLPALPLLRVIRAAFFVKRQGVLASLLGLVLFLCLLCVVGFW